MPILPDHSLPSARPATASADFDRKIHQERRHSQLWNSTTMQREPHPAISAGKVHVRFNPPYAAQSRKGQPPNPDIYARQDDFKPHGARNFPDVDNVEHFRGIATSSRAAAPANGAQLVTDENLHRNIAQVPPPEKPYRFQRGMARDAATSHYMRFRVGACGADPHGEAAGLKYHLHRHGFGPFDAATVNRMRGGIGVVNQGDKNWAAVELYPGFYQSAKPDRFYADLDSVPQQTFVIGQTSKFMTDKDLHAAGPVTRPQTAGPLTMKERPAPPQPGQIVHGTMVPRPGSAHVFGGPMGSVVRGPNGGPMVIRIGQGHDGRPIWK